MNDVDTCYSQLPFAVQLNLWQKDGAVPLIELGHPHQHETRVRRWRGNASLLSWSSSLKMISRFAKLPFEEQSKTAFTQRECDSADGGKKEKMTTGVGCRQVASSMQGQDTDPRA